MRRALIVNTTLVLCLAVCGVWRSAEAQATSELTGAWIVTSWVTPAGEVDSEPQRGLFMFTASGHYSIMYVLGDQPRAEWSGDTQTDAEKVEAYDSFVANSGRYSVEGNQITYEAAMAKNPNYMAAFGPDGANASTVEFSIQDNALTWRFTSGNATGATATFRRAGQQRN